MKKIPDVLESTAAVLERARYVRINTHAARKWAARRTADDFPSPAHPPALEFQGNRDASANLCLLLNSLNFCFWSEQPWSVEFRGHTWTRTYAMFASILRAVEADDSWLSSQRWMNASESEVTEVFRGEGRIPLLGERRQVLNETGAVLQAQFGGRMAQVVEQAGGSARAVAYLLAEHFPSFHDVAMHDDALVAFLKRAQICAADIHRTWRRNGMDCLTGMNELTAFADYRLPQYLRHVGILELASEFEQRINRRSEIVAGSPEEVELRAATIQAAELIRRAYDGTVPAWKIDFHLWQHSHDADVAVEHHRTRTVYY